MITLFLIDENPMFRFSLEKILKNSNISLIAEANTGKQSMELLRDKKQPILPDVILLNAQLPDISGEMLCQTMQRFFPKIPCVFLMNYVHLPTLSRLVNSPAKGFLTKEACYGSLEAIKLVYTGKTYLQPDLAIDLLNYRICSMVPGLEKLSIREYEILTLFVKRKTHDEIASLLHISIKTVYNLKVGAFKKLNIKSHIQLNELLNKVTC